MGAVGVFRSKNFNIELLEVIFGAHLRKHLRLLVGYCETSVTGVTPCVSKTEKYNNVKSSD